MTRTENDAGLAVEVQRLSTLTSERDFYLPWTEFAELLAHVMRRDGRCRLSLNRRQAGSMGLMHRFEWRGMRFTTVSAEPKAVV